MSNIAGVSRTKDRIAGRDRYAVSASIAGRVIIEAAKQDRPITGVILIAADNPAAFYDALAASPVASVLSTTALVGQRRYADRPRRTSRRGCSRMTSR